MKGGAVERRKFRAVKNYPGIHAGTRPGSADPDRWVVSFRVRGLGQRTRTFRSLAEAKAFRAQLQTKEKREELRRRDRGKVAFREYLLACCERRKDWAESTRARYGDAAELLLAGRLAGIHVSRIDREDVQGWVDDMARSGVPRGSAEKAFRLAHLVLGKGVPDSPVAGFTSSAAADSSVELRSAVRSASCLQRSSNCSFCSLQLATSSADGGADELPEVPPA